MWGQEGLLRMLVSVARGVRMACLCCRSCMHSKLSSLELSVGDGAGNLWVEIRPESMTLLLRLLALFPASQTGDWLHQSL